MIDLNKKKKDILDLISLKNNNLNNYIYLFEEDLNFIGLTFSNLKDLFVSINKDGFISDLDSSKIDLSEKEFVKRVAEGGADNRSYFFSFNISKNFNNLYDLKYNKESGVSKNKHVVCLPAGTKWSDIIIKFINGNDVEIILKNDKKFKQILDYKELGFYDKKRKKPNMIWNILTTASNFEGKFRWDSLGGTSEVEKLKKIDAFQKRISNLRKCLQNSFGIEDDPFEVSSYNKEYIIKINLIPEKSDPKPKKGAWEDMIDPDELAKYEKISKESFTQNPNEENKEYLGKY
ncbi:MAG: hypothetical protein ACOXZ1_03655 [Patescibacteria group bacterium]|jgi:hypothetical protein